MPLDINVHQSASAYLGTLETHYNRLVIGAAISSPSSSSPSSVLIVQRASNERSFPDQWELPGGGVDPGETIHEAVCREVREETGLKVTEITGQFAGFEYETSKFQEGERDEEDGNMTVRTLQLNFCVCVEECEPVVLNPDEHQKHAWCMTSTIDQYKMTPVMHTVVANALAAF